MISTFVGAPPTVRAARLTEESAEEILRWTNGYRLGIERWIPSERCWRVSALHWFPPTVWRDAALVAAALHAAGTLIVGIRTRHGERIATAGDWVVQSGGGAFSIVKPDAFRDLYHLPTDAER